MAPSIGVNLRVTGHSNQGGRKYMEDAFAVAYQQTEDEKDLEYAYFGIFDGHGGREAALFAKEHLMDYIVNQKNFWSDKDELVLKAIREGFISTHLAMWKEVANWPQTLSGLPSTSGTTASIIFIRKGKMYIGHVGDSAIVLGYKHPESNYLGVQPLTRDHKPESPSEKKRIEQTGGMVMSKSGVQRVVWNRPRIGHSGPVRRSTHIDQIPFLAVARSLGDLWSYDYLHGGFVVSPEPDVSAVTIDPKRDRCIILATDGLWNMISSQEAALIVQDAEEENERYILEEGGHKPWVNPSKQLVDRALDLWAKRKMRADNTTVVTVMLDPAGPPRSEVLLRQRILQKLRPREDFEAGYGERASPTSLDNEDADRQLMAGKSSDIDHVTAVSSERRVGNPASNEKRMITNIRRSIGINPQQNLATSPAGIYRRSMASLPTLASNNTLVQPQYSGDVKMGNILRRSLGGILPSPQGEKRPNEPRSILPGFPVSSFQERKTVVEVRHSVGGPPQRDLMSQEKPRTHEIPKTLSPFPQNPISKPVEDKDMINQSPPPPRAEALQEGTAVIKPTYATRRPELRRSLGTIMSKLKPTMVQRVASSVPSPVPLSHKHSSDIAGVDEEMSAGSSSDTENNGPPCPNSIAESVVHKSVYSCNNISDKKGLMPKCGSCNESFPCKRSIGLNSECNKHASSKSASSSSRPTTRVIPNRRRSSFETPPADLPAEKTVKNDHLKECGVEHCSKDGKPCTHDHKLRELSQKMETIDKKMDQKRQQCKVESLSAKTESATSSPSKRKQIGQVEGPATKQPRLQPRGQTWTSGCGNPSIIRHITRSRLRLRRVHV